MVLHYNCGSSRLSSLEKGRTWPAVFSVEYREDFCRASSGSLSSVFPVYAMRKGRDVRFCVLPEAVLTQLSNQSTFHFSPRYILDGIAEGLRYSLPNLDSLY